MKYYYYGHCLVLFLMAQLSVAQKRSFTFSDTYPTNNVDSLRNWLKTHPQPTEERLKNLIRLNRTHFFSHPDRINRDSIEIRQLSQRLNHPVGKAINKFWVSSNFRKEYEAFTEFETLKDTSGMIYTLGELASANYSLSAVENGDKYAAQDYLMKAKQLLKARFNAHDYFILERSLLVNNVVKAGKNQKENLSSLHKALALSESNLQYQYMRIPIKSFIGSLHSLQEDYATSYAIYKELLTQLKPDQTHVNILFSQNLSGHCMKLGRYDEKLALCNKMIFLLHKYEKDSHHLFFSVYRALKEEMYRRGRYKEASLYGDSLFQAKNMVYAKERGKKLIEFQSENKQKQIAELTLQQTQIENRNRFILTLLGIAVLVALALTYLGWRLRQSNTRLNALVLLRDEFIRIIAHDLRRPLHAFYGLSDVFSKLLQRGDQQSIIKLSRSIDQSGLYIRQMLDNLMYWALSQKGSLTLNSTTFALRPHLEDLMSVYGAVAALKGVNLTLSCPADLTVHTDTNALNLILRNLIDNATQHTPAQGSVSVEVIPDTEPHKVHIRVSDTGKGMTDVQLQLVKEVLATPQRFQPKQENLGLGLIIVSTFAKQAKITISVESQEGKGTTFWVKLPKET